MEKLLQAILVGGMCFLFALAIIGILSELLRVDTSDWNKEADEDE